MSTDTGALEKISGPFESFRERRDQALARLRAPPGETQEATLCWGGPGNYQFSTTAEQGGGFNTRDPKDDKDDPKEKVLEWHETSRKTKTVRVENPEDSEQYVMVKRIEKIAFRSPSEKPFLGKIHLFTLKNPD